jgi:Mg2+-importing ATPase
LAATTLLIVAIGLLLAVPPLAARLGFSRLPLSYFVFLTPATLAYLFLVDLAKRQLVRWLGL